MWNWKLINWPMMPISKDYAVEIFVTEIMSPDQYNHFLISLDGMFFGTLPKSSLL